MSLATWAALPTSVWMRMYAVTTGTTSLRHTARGAMQRLVPRAWWHAAAGSGDHVVARDAVCLPNGRTGRSAPGDHLGQQEERRCCIERSASASHLHPAGRQAQPRRHRGAKLTAGIEVLIARVAKHGHWSLRAPPRPCAIAPTALTALVSLLPSTCNAQGRRTVASRHG